LSIGLACSGVPGPSPAVERASAPDGGAERRGTLVVGATVVGGPSGPLWFEAGRVRAPGPPEEAAERLELAGAFVVPSFIDAHVHLAYFPVGRELARAGIAAVVDLAMPLGFLDVCEAGGCGPLGVIAAGPMITAPGGYPTRSWGSAGYGWEVDGPAEATAAVEALAARGLTVVKVPLTGEPTLDDRTLSAVVARAHALGLKVAAHALTERDARRAGLAGVDALAHTPLDRLTDETVQRFAGRAVISTLTAFGATPTVIDNLRRLRAAGAIVLYGTDLGNTRQAGIQGAELTALAAAGLEPAAILEAATAAPARFFGLEQLGALEPGKAASFMVLDRDPRVDREAVLAPRAVFLDGVRL
jgi:imidazolonepropionase-like amidohydrolase